MLNFLNLRELKLNWIPVIAIVSSTLILIVDHYRTIFPAGRVWDEFLLYFVIPMGIILVVFRDRPSQYGFQRGDWKAGLIFTAIGGLVVTGIVLLVARGSSFREYYTTERDIWDILLTNVLELFSWEFFFRGFLLFTLYREVGPIAIFLQAIPFALAHISKPELETLSTIFGGAAFGFIAWRTKSFLYPFMIHWYLATIIFIFAN